MNTISKIHEAEADNEFIPLLSVLGVGLAVQRLFLNSLHFDHGGRLVFNYYANNDLKDTELFGFKTVKLACTNGLWFAGDQHKPTNIFLFFSAMEAIAFAHLNNSKFNGFGRCLFVAMGVRPSKQQIDLLRKQFKECKFHTVFANDLIGKLYDCKASLWLTNKECLFTLAEDIVTVTAVTGKKIPKTISIGRSQFSYFSFHRQFGKRSNIKTHKPNDKNHLSFLGYLAQKNGF